MKFISKNSNLRIVLEPGVPSNQMAGVAGKNGVYVKFQDGEFNTDNVTTIEKMTSHPGFGTDYIMVDDNGEDPYAHRRAENEPVHVIQNIRYGQVESKTESPHKKKIDPQIQKLVNDMAVEKAKELLPSMVEEAVRKMMEIHDKRKSEDAQSDESAVVGEPDVSDIKNKKTSKKK